MHFNRQAAYYNIVIYIRPAKRNPARYDKLQRDSRGWSRGFLRGSLVKMYRKTMYYEPTRDSIKSMRDCVILSDSG